MRYETMLRSAIALSVLVLSPVSVAHAQLRDMRSYAARGSTLEIDGKSIGTVQTVEGGYAKADVVSMSLGPEDYPLKHISNVRFEPITVRGDINSLVDLARKAFDNKPVRANGRVLTMGMTGKSIGGLEFFNAIPTKVAISDLDGASREQCYIEVTLAPESTRRFEGGGAEARFASSKQERCMRSSFKVNIPGMVTNGVTKVENISLTRAVAQDNVGEQRIATKSPEKASIPNVVLTVVEGTAKDFWTWYDSFLIKGDNGQEKERTIDVQLMGPDMKTPVLTLSGTGVGMVAMRPLVGNDNLAKVEVELYVTKWALGGVAAAP